MNNMLSTQPYFPFALLLLVIILGNFQRHFLLVFNFCSLIWFSSDLVFACGSTARQLRYVKNMPTDYHCMTDMYDKYDIDKDPKPTHYGKKVLSQAINGLIKGDAV